MNVARRGTANRAIREPSHSVLASRNAKLQRRHAGAAGICLREWGARGNCISAQSGAWSNRRSRRTGRVYSLRLQALIRNRTSGVRSVSLIAAPDWLASKPERGTCVNPLLDAALAGELETSAGVSRALDFVRHFIRRRWKLIVLTTIPGTALAIASLAIVPTKYNARRRCSSTNRG